MECPRSIRPSLAPSRALLLLLLALLSGCRSERVAFQFTAGNVPTIVNNDAENLTPPAQPVTQLTSNTHTLPAKLSRRSRQMRVIRLTRHPPLAVAIPRRLEINQPGVRKQMLRQKAKGSAKAAHMPADSDYGITPLTIGIAVLLGLSIVFVGIPLLIGLQFSISYWTALLFWVGFIAAAVFIGLLPMIIDDISYNLMSEEKQMEKNKRDNERYRNNQR